MIGCLYFTVKPLWSHATGSGNWRASTVWADWLDRKKTLLFNLEDLTHEQRLGKISGEDFSRLETAYKKELVTLLDLMQNSRPPTDFENFLLGDGVTNSLREFAHPEESDYFQRQNASRAAGGPVTPHPRKDMNTKACFHCKVFYAEDFSFCPKCGAALTGAS